MNNKLLSAVLNNDIKAIEKALKYHENPVARLLHRDINRQTAGGDTILTLSVQVKSVKYTTIEYLLTHGADPNIANCRGETALHKAAMRNEPDLINMLLAQGADMNAKDVFPPFSHGDTPLIRALVYDAALAFECLLAQGADVTILDNAGNSVVHQAVFISDLVYLKKLLAHGVNINAQNSAGDTPLIVCLKERFDRSSELETIELLLTHGVDVTIKNKQGQCALHLIGKLNYLPDSIKGKMLSLFLFSTEVIQSLESDELLRGFCKATKLPLELYLNIVEYVKLNMLNHIIPEIPLEKKSDWLSAYQKDQKENRRIENQAQSEQTLPETRYRP